MKIPSRGLEVSDPSRRLSKRIVGACLMTMLVIAAPARAAMLVTFLGIDGQLGPGAAGNYPLDAEFSWISHHFPGNTVAHIWTLAPGSDGGIIIHAAQPGQGQITAPRNMYNVTSWLFSVDTGVVFDHSTEMLDVSNLRLFWGVDVYDFGFGSTRSGQVPHIAGPQDAQAANGWWQDAQGKYHLVFRGDGQCEGCELTVHLTGLAAISLLGDLAPKDAPDGQINIADLLQLMRFVTMQDTPSGQAELVADINGDSVVDVRDALAMGVILGY